MLTDYPAALPAATVTLPVAEIVAIVGCALPPGAHERPFWQNSPKGAFGQRLWVRPSWRVVTVHHTVAVEPVTFVRVASGSTG